MGWGLSGESDWFVGCLAGFHDHIVGFRLRVCSVAWRAGRLCPM